LYTGINDFKKGYQPRNNIVKNEKGDVIADCHSIMVKVKQSRYRPGVAQRIPGI
jgi:hypothetical protein